MERNPVAVHQARAKKKRSRAKDVIRGAYGLGGLFAEPKRQRGVKRKRASSKTEKALAHREKAKKAMAIATKYRKEHPTVSLKDALIHGWKEFRSGDSKGITPPPAITQDQETKQPKQKKRRRALDTKKAEALLEQVTTVPATSPPPQQSSPHKKKKKKKHKEDHLRQAAKAMAVARKYRKQNPGVSKKEALAHGWEFVKKYS